MDDPYRHLGGDPHPIVTNPDTPFLPYQAYVRSIDPDINSPRVQSWNVTVERQLGTDWARIGQLSGQLLGSPVVDDAALNPGVYLGLGPCTLQGVVVPGVHDNGQHRTAARAVALG